MTASPNDEDTCSPEEHVRQIRAALDAGDRPAAGAHFVTLLQQSSASTERWLRRVIAMTPALHNASAYPVSEDLRQELALHVWERIAVRRDAAWEHRYWRALTYAQQHVGEDYMLKAGYWVDRRFAQTTRGVALPLTDDHLTLAAPDGLAAAELAADVRAVVMRLPPKERAAVVLRYWGCMGEREIGEALGYTNRQVRTLLRQARGRMGAWYDGRLQDGAAPAVREL